MQKGKIIKAIAGFFYVSTEDSVYECKARNNFKRDGNKLIVGDNVTIDVLSENDKNGVIIEKEKRKNQLIRPAIANIDQSIIVVALSYPKPDFRVLDKVIINNLIQNISSVILFNKSDEVSQDFISYIEKSYRNSGIPIYFISALNENLDKIYNILCGKLSVFTGNSGVGKSTIINNILKQDTMNIGDISKKIKRGKHTTKHSEIFTIDRKTYITDTPGYGRFDLNKIDKLELQKMYPEFKNYCNCKYSPCTHTHEPLCCVKKAVEEGKISKLRYDNYLKIYKEIEEMYE